MREHRRLWPDRVFPIARGLRMLIAGAALLPSMLGASVIGIMTQRSLPTATALGDSSIMRSNIVASVAYGAVIIPTATLWGLIWTTLPRERIYEADRHRLIVAMPARLTTINAAVWIAAALYMAAVNYKSPWLATTLSTSTLLGGVVTAALTYWFCTRVLRNLVAAVLTEQPPDRPRGPGLRLRALTSWSVGTAVPLAMVLLVAASALVVECSVHRLAVAVLVLGGLTLATGLFVAAFSAATVADPIHELRRGMQSIEGGDYCINVPVFDASELGMLQAGFNTMARGLREREKLRELFGRHVGREVARLAERSDAYAHESNSGVQCEVAVVFVDVVGSTRLAADLPPKEVVAILNDFFAIVVDVVEASGGLINKFEGDAVLAIFGAPTARDDYSSQALSAARQIQSRLVSAKLKVKAAVGVSAGPAAAGNVGGPSRYEYTVIGDPVNEAARLTEVAKEVGGVAASSAALARAAPSEARRWEVVESRLLRGRRSPTEIAVPRDFPGDPELPADRGGGLAPDRL